MTKFLSASIVTVLAATLVLATASTPSTPPAAASATNSVVVKIDNFTFSPKSLTVRTGAKVTWVNKDDVPHTVVSDDKKFKSGVLDTDGEFTHTFTARGTYSYYCSVHPHMTAKIVVR